MCQVFPRSKAPSFRGGAEGGGVYFIFSMVTTIPLGLGLKPSTMR